MAESGALTPEQQENLNAAKVLLRLENEQYLREHPELKKLLNAFFLKALNDRPAKLDEYAAKFFTDDSNYEGLS